MVHTRTRKHRTAKKHHSRRYRKGSNSRTRRGRKDFSTKKSSKVFNRRSRYQKRSSRGALRRPFRKQRGGWLLDGKPWPGAGIHSTTIHPGAE